MKRLEAPSYTKLAISGFLVTVRLSNAFSIPSIRSWTRAGSEANILERRASDNSGISSAISVASSQYWDGIDGPWSSFPLQVGTGSVGGLQDVRVFPSTAGTAIWTIGAEGCPNNYVENCPNSRGFLFLRNQSLTWTADPGSIYQTGPEANLGMDSSGYVGYDVATLGWQGSTTVTNQHSIIWNMADSNYWLGVFGLNPRPTNLSTFSNPQESFMQSIFNRNAIPSLTYGYTAGNKYRLDGVFGSLTLGGYDTNRFTPNDVSFDFYTDISRDLLVNLHGVTADKTTPSNLLPGGSISIFIDSTVAEMWLPRSACTAFEDAFGLEYNADFQRYIVTSSQREKLLAQGAEVTFTIGPDTKGGKTVNITLPYHAFDLQVSFPIIVNQESSLYYFPLQRAANETQYTLGRTFLQEAYLIADYERQNFSVSACEWDEQKLQGQNIVSIISPNATRADSDDEPLFSTAEIAGIGVGSISAIAILSFALFILHRRKQQKRRHEELAAKDVDRSSASSSSSRPVISNPIGGELGGGDVHEIHTSNHKVEMSEMESHHGYNEIVGGGYSGSGKYYRYSVTEMDGVNTTIYEMPGSEVQELPMSEPCKGPRVPPK